VQTLACRRFDPRRSPPFCRRGGPLEHCKEVRNPPVLFVHVLAFCFDRAHLPELAPSRPSASPGCALLPWLDYTSWCPRSVARAVLVVPVPPALETEPPSSRSAKLAGAPPQRRRPRVRSSRAARRRSDGSCRP
jgi:hypothetical protein